MQEIYDQEKHINHLQGAIMNMGPPLKVAQTRLSMRGGRPEIEACRDQPHHRYSKVEIYIWMTTFLPGLCLKLGRYRIAWDFSM